MSGKEYVRVIQRTGHREIHMQFVPGKGETSETLAGKIDEIIQAHDAHVIRATFFGKLSEEENTLTSIGKKLPETDFPCSWIEGGSCTDAFINGVYIFAVSGLEVSRLYLNNDVVGSYYQTGEADFCFLGGLYSDPGLTPSEQTEQILNSADNLLKQAGLSYENTVRTWFYLDDILSWYDDFNRARTSFYRRQGIFNKLVPASTGIGGQNPRASKVCLELTAINPRSNRYFIEKISSPMQCSAEEYGSAFSRAVKVSDSEYESMTISGTASINREGKTMYPGDPWKQIELSFSVIRAILDSQGFSFGDVVRSYAYCSDKNYTGKFGKYMETCVPVKFAFILAQNDICRDELTFEIEVDVIRKKIYP
jgi:enamine deaminase RidA (YjgF/YER057c/UK114 family)